MAISVVMPALEMAQESGKLISWLKKEGDAVAKGEPLLEIETDKAIMEIESPGDGVLAGIKAEAGAEVPVGRTIAWIVRPGENPPAEESVAVSGRRTATAAPRSTVEVQTSTSASSSLPPLKISPKARRLANEHGVNLADVRGSGAGGEILAADILAAAEARAAAPPLQSPQIRSRGDETPRGEADSGRAVARLMAERTTQGWTTVPHFFVTREVDAGALNGARQRFGKHVEDSSAVKLTHSDLLIALVARVLRAHPRLNATWTGEGIRDNRDINIGLAIAVENGVVAPVIHHADKTELAEIARQRRDLTERARAGKLRPADLAGVTFTISNLGMFGVDAFTAIIIPPQAAILAVGAIVDRVVPIDNHPAIRPMMSLTLSADHRVVDGARAAEFLRDFVEAVQNPDQYLHTGTDDLRA
jgi:pyruvate dehydrogenase E2 component (dihydrolipoamide acetyltransferase)